VISLTRDEVRRIDCYAIEVLGISGAVLMENAGRGATDVLEQLLTSLEGKAVAIVAGRGNNGGDGFVVARHLRMRGFEVVTFLVAPEDKIFGAAGANLRIIRNLGHDIRDASGRAIETLAESLRTFDVVVDAVGGTGISGKLRGRAAAAVEQINAAARPVVAIDIPTGLDCDSGAAAGPAVRATMTVTMLVRKKGFDNPAAAEFTGKVRVVNIGVPADVVAELAAGESQSENR